MKKKILIFIVAMLCSVGVMAGITNGDATAISVQCTQGAITAKECAEKLKSDSDYDSLKGTCNNSSDGCKSAIKKHLTCKGGTGETGCANWKETFANNVKSYIDGANGGSSKTDADSSKDSGDDSGDSGTTEESKPVELESVTEGSCTSLLPSAWCDSKDGSGIQEIVGLVIAILTGGVVVAGTIGLIYCGFIWMTAREDENKVATAKRRMMEIVIGIIAWVLIYALANLFIPKTSQEIKSGEIKLDAGTKVIRNIAMENDE